ncbi:MAG: PAS domain-containing protein [Proteobacteria bacterium]|nr:PAS domain-containing protein [Pseudomonadota bacterium]MBU1716313.1 PAS domain-containing protein [Pseudomonadota bacterium]
MTISWEPVIYIDILGSASTLLIALWSICLSWQWLQKEKHDTFRNYIFLLTLSFVIFAISRSFGHLVKQFLVLNDMPQSWQAISPFSGSINTTTFITVFAFGIYFRRFTLAHNEIENYRDNLEDLIKERTGQIENQVAFQQQLIDSIPAAIFFKDLNGCFLGCNENFARLTGLSKEEIIGKTEFDVAPPEVAEKYHRQDLDVMREGEAYSFEGQLEYNIRSEQFAIFSKAAFADQQGRITGMIGSIFDITNHHNLEIQLRQTQKMESIGTLAGGIAHDFNNILAAIMGFSELALHKIPPDSSTHADIKHVIDASIKARDLVKQILTFSRQDKLESIPTKITPIIQDISRLLEKKIPKNIEIRLKLEAENGVIMADPGQIYQILFNLCDNSLHAMREKGGTIGISLVETVLSKEDCKSLGKIPPGRYMKITTSDTGCGMGQNIINRIFEPFFTTKKFGEGKGMGLAVIHGIILNHGGAVKVSSTPEIGTSFEIFLPISAERKEAVVKKTTDIPRGNERIMVVDDEQILIDMFKNILGDLGYQVEGITESPRALQRFKVNPDQYDLVITDQVMPVMIGTEMIKEMLKIRADIPIIMCTGFSESEPELKKEITGIKAFAMKPILTRDFATTIRQVLDQSKKDFTSSQSEH